MPIPDFLSHKIGVTFVPFNTLDTLKKSTKRFLISSEATNTLGFRVRTAGIDLADFYNNPTTLWMHYRPRGNSRDEVLPLGYWEDLELKDGKLYGTPVFDDSDDFAMKIYKKVENGTIRMASAGLMPKEWGKDLKDPWLERSKMVEASIVDRGSNAEALCVALYDADDSLINLADATAFTDLFTKTHKTNMNLINLSAPVVLPLLKLSDSATEDQVTAAIRELVTLADTQASTITSLTTAKAEAETKITDLETKLTDQVKLAFDGKVKAYMLKAADERKILAGEVDGYIGLAGDSDDSFEKVRKIIDAKPAVSSVEKLLSDKGTDADAEKLTKLAAQPYDTLFADGNLEFVKLNAPDDFKRIFKEKFGKEPKG